jgi:glycosyltransferase involved in cell wall biosynthesis
MKRIKLGIYATHPTQYHVPIFRYLTNEKCLDVSVLYGDDAGIKPVYSPEFNTVIKWDLPLLEGYKYKFFTNLSKNKIRGFFSRINPGMILHLMRKGYSIVLIHGYQTFSSWIVFIVAKIIGAKIIWRGEAILRKPHQNNIIIRFAKGVVLTAYFRMCDAVLYSCSANKEYLEQYNVPDNKMFFAPCAVDNEYFRGQRKKYIDHKKELKIKVGFNVDDLVVLYVARFTQRKRPLDLINAVERIFNENIGMLFVGDGPERSNMEKAVKEKKLKAVFTGFQGQQQLSQYYSSADIFVIVSERDASPKALNEALNFELPVIASCQVGTARDLVLNDVNGFIIESNDLEMLAAKIDYLNNNRERLREMGRESLEISNKWSMERVTDGIKRSINHVLAGNRGKR